VNLSMNCEDYQNNNERNYQTLPNTVRSLPNMVRSSEPRKRSSRLSYQGTYETGYIFDNDFWIKFEEYLVKNYRKSSVRCRLLYAKKYLTVLTEENAQSILVLPINKKLQVMKSLAILSKFLGCYDRWKQIKERYQLKWTDNSSLQVFQNITNEESNYTSMLKWLKDICSQIPSSYSNHLIYCTLTGLRAEESCQSISILKNDYENYVNNKKMTIEHFRYPEIFLRKTKQAYISIINDNIIKIAKEAGNHNYNSLRCYFKRKGISMNMNFCRKIFATHLRNKEIHSEVIDLLQGRIPKSIFLRNYFKPDINNEVIRECLDSLYLNIIK